MCHVPLTSFFNKNTVFIYLSVLWWGNASPWRLYGGQGKLEGVGSLLPHGSPLTHSASPYSGCFFFFFGQFLMSKLVQS